MKGLDVGGADVIAGAADPPLKANDESWRLVCSLAQLGQTCGSSAFEADVSFSNDPLHV